MRWLALVLVGLAACVGDMAATLDRGTDCPDNSVTMLVAAEPAVVARNAEVDITLRWEVTDQLVNPVATLRIGESPAVEVEVPLADESNGGKLEYRGTLLNPFGAGAPAGTVEVLVEASPAPGCIVFPTASAAFILE